MEEFIIQSKVLQSQHMQIYHLKESQKAKYLKKYQIPLSDITINNITHGNDDNSTQYQNIKIVSATKNLLNTSQQNANLIIINNMLTYANKVNKTKQQKEENKQNFFFHIHSKVTQSFKRKMFHYSSPSCQFRKLIRQKIKKHQKKYKRDKNILKEVGKNIQLELISNQEKQEMSTSLKKYTGPFQQKSYKLQIPNQPSIIKKNLRTSRINESSFRKSIDLTKSPYKTPSQSIASTPSKSKTKSKQRKISKQRGTLNQTKRQFVCLSVQNLRKTRVATVKGNHNNINTSRNNNQRVTDRQKISKRVGKLGTPSATKSVRRNYYDSNYHIVWKRSQNCFISPQKTLSIQNKYRNQSNSSGEKQNINEITNQDQIKCKQNIKDEKQKIKKIKKNRHILCKTASIIPKTNNKFYNQPQCYYQWNAKPKKQKIEIAHKKNKNKHQSHGLINSFDVQNHVPLSYREIKNENMRIMSKYRFNNKSKYNNYIEYLCNQSKF